MRTRRGRTTLTATLSALTAVLALSGCGSTDKGTPAKPGDPTKAAASTSATAENVADPTHAVPPPGPFDGKQYGDDLLVVSQHTISDADIARITGVTIGKGKSERKGVAAYTRLSYGQFTVENKLYNIVAVDPAEYRRFNGTDAARFQAEWDRVAGGEIAIPKAREKELVPDKSGYLEVNDQRIHIGALSPGGVDGVDAVVNAKWGRTLGLPEKNAVLINTGISSPQAVRKKIEKLVGRSTYSISNLDIVAQEGLDLGTFQNVVLVGAFRDAVGTYRYTPLGGGRIAPDPAWVKSHIVTEVVPILGAVTCNKYMMPQLKAALQEVVRRGLADQIQRGQYGGCFVPRFIAGSTQLSNHSFGLALDLNVPGNQRGTVGQMNREVVSIFKLWGFAWGGDWAYTDPMHFEVRQLVNPG
jgi:hypothetical protein